MAHGAITGQVVTVFVVVLAAAEATVALAIVLSVFRSFRAIDVTQMNTLED